MHAFGRAQWSNAISHFLKCTCSHDKINDYHDPLLQISTTPRLHHTPTCNSKQENLTKCRFVVQQVHSHLFLYTEHPLSF